MDAKWDGEKQTYGDCPQCEGKGFYFFDTHYVVCEACTNRRIAELEKFVQSIAENTPRHWNKDANIDWLRAQAYVLWMLGDDARALFEKKEAQP